MEGFDKVKEFCKIATLLNWAMVFVHGSLLVFFYFHDVSFMFYFNIGSLAVYVANFFVIKQRLVRLFLYLTVLEVLIHMTAADICCGAGSGFSLYAFAVLSVIHYTKYIYGDRPGMGAFVILTTIITALLFIFLKVYSFYFLPLYSVGKSINALYLANSILSFSLIIGSLANFTRGVLSSEQSLQALADFDELTNLFNRHKMNEILDKLCSDKRNGKFSEKCYVSIMDIDDFKMINDKYGHNAGDYVLKTIAKIMRTVCREYPVSYACRWGGEEFLIVQTCSESLNKCGNGVDTIEKILENIRNYDFVYDSRPIKVTMTAGIACPDNGDTVISTIKKADESLYWGKQHGKNQLVKNF